MTQPETIPVEIRVGDQHYRFDLTEPFLRVCPESAARLVAAKAQVVTQIAAEKL